MSDPRNTGLLLMATAIAAFLGTTSNALPPVTFFPALILFVAGAIKFMKSNHTAPEQVEDKVQRAAQREIPENRHVQAQAHSVKPSDEEPLSAIQARSTKTRTRSLPLTQTTSPSGDISNSKIRVMNSSWPPTCRSRSRSNQATRWQTSCANSTNSSSKGCSPRKSTPSPRRNC